MNNHGLILLIFAILYGVVILGMFLGRRIKDHFHARKWSRLHKISLDEDATELEKWLAKKRRELYKEIKKRKNMRMLDIMDEVVAVLKHKKLYGYPKKIPENWKVLIENVEILHQLIGEGRTLADRYDGSLNWNYFSPHIRTCANAVWRGLE